MNPSDLGPLIFPTAGLGRVDPCRTAGRAGLPARPAGPIHPEDIADVAELALTTDTVDGETISLGGPQTLSFGDQVQTLGGLLERRIELREPTREQAAEQLRGHVPAPLVEAVLDYWSQLPGEQTEAARSVERITGRPGRTFRQWATEQLAMFR
ncbi:hypothetical protein OG203_17200 [Nocardia sp. NBC_01499]|uniref:hypothetical protein n=1 Tax=Nocardia sp. NBC_01499 TaxID=2903597 RepID=UPI00386ADDC7